MSDSASPAVRPDSPSSAAREADMPHCKQRLRGQARARREAAAQALPPTEAGTAVSHRLLALWQDLPRLVPGHTAPTAETRSRPAPYGDSPDLACCLSGYWPIGSEVDCRPSLQALHARGCRCALPVVVEKAAPLQFRCWTPETVMRPGRFGAQVPPPEAEHLKPVFLLVPLLAFDRSGGRLGYGGGYYDRSLAQLRSEAEAAGRPLPLAIGLAYAAQEVPAAALPLEPTDIRLDWIVTEKETIRVAEASSPEGSG